MIGRIRFVKWPSYLGYRREAHYYLSHAYITPISKLPPDAGVLRSEVRFESRPRSSKCQITSAAIHGRRPPFQGMQMPRLSLQQKSKRWRGSRYLTGVLTKIYFRKLLISTTSLVTTVRETAICFPSRETSYVLNAPAVKFVSCRAGEPSIA